MDRLGGRYAEAPKAMSKLMDAAEEESGRLGKAPSGFPTVLPSYASLFASRY